MLYNLRAIGHKRNNPLNLDEPKFTKTSHIAGRGGFAELWPCLASLRYHSGRSWRRSILLLDVLRQRGNNCVEHNARKAPNVLSFDAELVLDGRTLPRPVNYGLVPIIPPKGTSIDPSKRPFTVFDPRAGHGPGIGGMKHDSEIGGGTPGGIPGDIGFFVTWK